MISNGIWYMKSHPFTQNVKTTSSCALCSGKVGQMDSTCQPVIKRFADFLLFGGILHDYFGVEGLKKKKQIKAKVGVLIVVTPINQHAINSSFIFIHKIFYVWLKLNLNSWSYRFCSLIVTYTHKKK